MRVFVTQFANKQTPPIILCRSLWLKFHPDQEHNLFFPRLWITFKAINQAVPSNNLRWLFVAELPGTVLALIQCTLPLTLKQAPLYVKISEQFSDWGSSLNREHCNYWAAVLANWGAFLLSYYLFGRFGIKQSLRKYAFHNAGPQHAVDYSELWFLIGIASTNRLLSTNRLDISVLCVYL